MSKIYLLFFFIFSFIPHLKASEYEITVLATNTANFGGIGEWSFSALLESEEEKILFDTGFDENTVKIPKIEQKIKSDHKRGWGLQLIKELMDTVEFESTDEGTTVTMTKKK